MNVSPLQRILDNIIVPAVRTDDDESAFRAVKAIEAGGVSVLELPLTVPGALEMIRQLRKSDPQLLVGAGTVLDEATARTAILAGAQFIVCPSLNIDVIRCCRRYSIPVIPGALTPTEIVSAWEAGADIVKVFPASAMGGANYIKAISAPLPHIALMPMGGVNTETASAYLLAGACALGVGADLVPRSCKTSDSEARITAKTKQYVATIAAYQAKS